MNNLNYTVLEAPELSAFGVIMMLVIKLRRIAFQAPFYKHRVNYIYSVDEYKVSDINFDFPIKYNCLPQKFSRLISIFPGTSISANI